MIEPRVAVPKHHVRFALALVRARYLTRVLAGI